MRWISSQKPGSRLGSSEPILRLNAGREKSLLRRHPWIFSGAVAEVSGEPGCGDTVRVVSKDGAFLAWAAFSPQSQIRSRVWSWDEAVQIDEQFFRSQLLAAISNRAKWLINADTEAVRLCHAESDGLPGLVIDRYADTLVVQFLSCGPERWRDVIAGILADIPGIRTVFERSDADVRELEGLEPRRGLLSGSPFQDRLIIEENGIRFLVDIPAGHKTGFYLDQRQNRLRLRSFAPGAEVLDCFAYTGGFSMNALAGGAANVSVVDSSGEALQIAKANLELNDLPAEKCRLIQADVFQLLREYRDRGKKFDLIVLDPPKFAPTAAQAERAARGYKDINLLAFKLLRPHGILFTFSCSGGIDMALFQKIVAGAALDAGVDARIIERLHQGPDHPIALNFPEGEYLKGLIVQAG